MAIITRRMILALLLVLPATATHALPLTTFEFVANCSDCAEAANVDSFDVTITLELKNYRLGDDFAANNFHAFSYSGSNLVADFSVDRSDWSKGQGSYLAGFAPENYQAGDPLGIELLVTKQGKGKKPNAAALWNCTALGWQVADPLSACENTTQLVFMMLQVNGEWHWQLGAPAKDHGNIPGAHLVSEPASLGLVLAGMFAARRRRAATAQSADASPQRWR